jgi:glycosyltransferase involved in cell wall biosynthesis
MLNYNGAKIMDVMREAVESVKVAGYDSYEFILVDNGSTDGSYEAISKYVESAGLVRTTVVRSERNLGFTGGITWGSGPGPRDRSTRCSSTTTRSFSRAPWGR